MKRHILIGSIFSLISSFCVGQIKISDMPIYSGNADSAYFPGVLNNTNRKILGKNINKPRLDSITTAMAVQNNAIAATRTVLTTISGLRALSSPDGSVVYRTTDRKQEGDWYYDASDNSSTDNTGTILVCGTKRFKRIYSGYANALWFGIDNTGVVDCTTLCNQMDTAGIPHILFPPGPGNAQGIYKISNTVTFRTANIRMQNSKFSYTGTKDRTALFLGSTSANSNQKLLENIWVEASTLSSANWVDTNFIGVRICRVNSSRVSIFRVANFYMGVQVGQNASGISYNTFELGEIVDNRVGLDFYGTNAGYVNENLWLNGKFQCSSASLSFGARFGIRVREESGYKHNNNIFVKPSFELNGGIPIIMQSGNSNEFVSCRDEANSIDTFALETGSSSNNKYSVADGVSLLINTSSFPSSVLTRRSKTNLQNTSVIFNSGSLGRLTVPYSSTSQQTVGIHYYNSPNATTLIAGSTSGATPFSYSDKYIVIPINRGVGVYLSTVQHKKFTISASLFPGGQTCRFAIVPYDSSNNIISSTDTVFGNVSSTFSYTTNWGTGWGTSSNSVKDYFFKVTNNTAYCRVIVFTAGDGNPTFLSALRIISVDVNSNGAETTWTGFESSVVPGTNVASAVPASGTWIAGKRIYKHQPSAGDVEGWICTTGGTPGTWKTFGVIAP